MRSIERGTGFGIRRMRDDLEGLVDREKEDDLLIAALIRVR
jgi:hypothetical protein